MTTTTTLFARVGGAVGSRLFALGLMALLGGACGGDDGGSDVGADSVADADTGVAPDTGDATEADTADTSGPGLMLHVPSPDWSEQVIYFVMIDRFDNGDATNDDQGAGEYDPATNAKYSGGDLQGIIDRLDYIQGLGATAIWITPPVKNQWWDPVAQFSGYHGYWARDLRDVDEHYGAMADYEALSDALHRRGMFLIQDIVPNHMGNFFNYDEAAWSAADPTAGYSKVTGALPGEAPEDPAFALNDPRNEADRAAAQYHWTPPISNYLDAVQEKTWQISGLDDLNTENPTVMKALRERYGAWITNVGVDGFRIDTAKFIDHPFWRDFIHGTDAEAPGVNAVAAATGRDDFLTFGEVYEVSDAYDDTAEQKLSSYLGTTSAPEIGAVLGFPLYEELKEVIGGGRATAALSYRLNRFMDPTLFPDPYKMPNFIDNHDVQRFLAAASQEAFEQALIVIFTIPGIPVVYQGTEQGFTETRAAMFAGGWMSGGEDHFDTTSADYTFLKGLIAARRANPVLQKGDLEILQDAAGPGVLAYERALPDGAEAVVLLNTAEEPVLVADLDVGLPSGTKLRALTGRGDVADSVVGYDDRVLLELPARGARVLAKTDETVLLPAKPATITVDTAISGETFTADAVVTGTVTPASTTLVMVVDDLVARKTAITVGSDGTWSATIPVASFPYGDNPHTVTFYAPEANVASARMHFRSNTEFDGTLVHADDPAGDDTGPAGTYFYPSDATFQGAHYGDIVGVDLEASGATLRLKLHMADHSTTWNPSNGYDHVSFSLYFDLPGVDGVTVLPKLQAEAPEGFAWDISAFEFGWTNAFYKSDGATATEWGTPSPGRPKIAVDAATKTITFEFNGALVGLTTWEGVSFYGTTWDFDGIDNLLRPLSPAGGQWAFGGGEATDPLILDSVGPVLIPVTTQE
ncbi:MAG: hypothetical protein KC635_12990 [Myxococcales bacterium]|nr:hypothetical protein [Myxococcales bacterium]